ncbi:hypothetical protein, partial [Oscillibacter sp. CU971]|uniref:hypothetical protein n=1 Tax=Oscillibacter sp. CU971 TaxID=2780102 RepID=UPI00195A7183
FIPRAPFSLFYHICYHFGGLNQRFLRKKRLKKPPQQGPSGAPFFVHFFTPPGGWKDLEKRRKNFQLAAAKYWTRGK